MAAESSKGSTGPQEAFKTAVGSIGDQSKSTVSLISLALERCGLSLFLKVLGRCLFFVSLARPRLQNTDEHTYPNGISLLSAKNDTLLSYLQHMVLLMLARLDGQHLPASAVKELVKDRVILEKMRPLEAKLRYQVEKLLRKAESAASHTEDGSQDLGMLQGFRCVYSTRLNFRQIRSAIVQT